MISDILRWLDTLEYKINILVRNLEKLVTSNRELVTYMADNNICYNNICFTNNDGTVFVVNTDNNESVRITIRNTVTSAGIHVDVDIDVHGYNTLVYIIDNWDRIMRYAEAVRTVEKHLGLAMEALRRAERIAYMYNDYRIADKVWDAVKKWLSIPVIV